MVRWDALRPSTSELPHTMFFVRSRLSRRVGSVVGSIAGSLALFGIAVGAGAQTGTPATAAASLALTLDGAVARALERNPDLLASRLRVDSARAEAVVARAIPNPVVSTIPGTPSQYAVQLPLDVGPGRHYRSRAAGEGVTAAQLDAADTRRQITFTVRQAFYDVLLADSLRTLAEDQAATFQRLLLADSARLRSGGIAERDVVTTRLQLAHSEALRARAIVQQHATRLTLETLLGSSTADTNLLISGSLAYRDVAVALDSIGARAVAHRPDYAAATMRVSQSTSLRSLARASFLPVPLVGAAYQPAEPFASGRHVAASIGFTVPVLYAFSGERARSQASLAAAEITAERIRLQMRAELALAVDAYLSARALADRYACGLLADAAGALESAHYAYDRGATSLPDFLEAVRAYADTRSDYLVAVHDYWVSLFALERSVGADVIGAVQ